MEMLGGTGCRPGQLFPPPALKVAWITGLGRDGFSKELRDWPLSQRGKGNDGLLRTLDDLASFSVALRMTHNPRPETEEQVDKKLGNLYVPFMDHSDSRNSGPTCP